MPARVTVTLPEKILELLDSIADAEGWSRSQVVREAASNYLSQRESQSALSARGEAVGEGLAWLAQVAQCVPDGTPDSLDLLHEIRAEGGGAGEPLGRDQPAGQEPR